MKERVCGKKVIGANLPAEQSPFFEVTVNIETETNRVFVTIDPSLDDV